MKILGEMGVQGLEDAAFINEICTLIEEPQISLFLSFSVRTLRRRLSMNKKGKYSQEPNHTGTPISSFQPPKLRNEFLSFISCLVFAAAEAVFSNLS